MTLKQLIDENCRKYSSQKFLLQKRQERVEKKTYSDFYHDVTSLSTYLYNNVGDKNKIVLLGANSYQWIVIYMAIVHSGNIVVLLNPECAKEELLEICGRVKPILIFVDQYYEKNKDVLCSRKYAVTVYDKRSFGDYSDNMKKNAATALHENELDENSICNIIFTSGTTGKSKGVMLSHVQIYEDLKSFGTRMRDELGEMGINILPFHHAYALLCDVWMSLFLGKMLFISSKKGFFNDLPDVKPDYLFTVPEIAEKMMKQLRCVDKVEVDEGRQYTVKNRLFGENLKVICSGGSFVKESLVGDFEDYGITFIRGYGMTECSPVISVLTPSEKADASTVGKPLLCNEIDIQDGEICVKGSNVMVGYYDDIEETNDMGYISTAGYLYITGRKKEMIILENGENISPAQMEEEIKRITSVRDVLVFVDERGDAKQLKAIVCKEEDMETDDCTMMDCYNAQVPLYKKIRGVCRGEGILEKTATCKLKREQTLQRFMRVEVFKIIERSIRQNLIIDEDICITTRLYEELGLDSFETMRIIIELEEVMNIDIPEIDIATFITIEDICSYVVSKKYFINNYCIKVREDKGALVL